MFRGLLKRVFGLGKKENTANYAYFEETKNTQESDAEEAVQALQSSLNNKRLIPVSTEERHQIAFYDFLFGESTRTAGHDELSLYVADKVELLLQSPKYILQALPILPTSLSTVIEQLNDEEFDTDLLVELIQQDPVIAAKVIELANSALYNRGNKAITDLKTAFMQLGTTGLVEGVINGFVSKLVPKSPIYFQQYGVKLWQHSLSTGTIAKQLLIESGAKEEAAQGYLVGLICNLGDMIIYQLMMEAFSVVHPDSQPNSFAFKELMLKNSKKLAYFIAKYWKFPQEIVDILALQTKITTQSKLPLLLTKRPIACYVYEANMLSEIELLFFADKLDESQVLAFKSTLIASKEARDYLNQMVKEKLEVK